MAKSDAYQEALKRIKAAATSGAKELDLANLGLTELPPEIGSLTALQTLDLYSNRLTTLPPKIGSLTALQSLNLNSNQLTTLPPELGSLTALQTLYLYSNQLTTLPPEIGSLTALQTLHLSDNQLTTLPPVIGSLTALQTLYLYSNQLTTLPPEIGSLTALRMLWLNSNQLTTLPPVIGSLTALQTLYLYSNQLTTLPPEIGSLTALQTLHLSDNQLTTLPPEIGSLTALQTLRVDSNQLTTLPPEIGSLTALRMLWLNSNQLTTLPPVIGSLTALQTLYLYSNQLTTLPPVISSLTALQGLFLHGNPGLGLPPEVLGPDFLRCTPYGAEDPSDPAEMLRFYFRLQEERRKGSELGIAPSDATLNEVKILIVGEPGVGKTDLAHWLIYGKPHPDPKSTVGIKIATWQLPETPIRANVWDFGGQEIMQATHQFFLTERSLYLLVLDSRENEEQGKVRYWLDKIRAFGGDSPVIVVLNKIDEGQEQPDEPRLVKDYSSNLLDPFFRTACRGGKWAKASEGIDKLRLAIRDRASKFASTGVPSSYLKAKGVIEAAAKQSKKLDRTQFVEACNRAGVPDDELDRKTLLTFLKNLGTVYYYERPGRPGQAARTFVLDPEWLSDGVYTILTDNHLLECGGRLDPKTLGQLFARSAAEMKHHYAEEDHDFLLEMMEDHPFDLCFRIPNRPDDLRLVPERLQLFEPPHGIQREGSRNVEYHYEYLPGGLIPRFIVRMHEYLHDGDAWRNGVVLTIAGQRVLVRGVKEEKRVYVSADGHTAASRRALETVRENLLSIHRAMKHVKVTERVPMPDNVGVTYTYQGLCELERNPKKGPNYEFTPDGAKRDYLVRELLDEIEAPEARRAYVRVGKFDESPPRIQPNPAPQQPMRVDVLKLAGIALGTIVVLGLTLAVESRIVVGGAVIFAIIVFATVVLAALIFIVVARFSGAMTGTAFERMIDRVLGSLSLLPKFFPGLTRPARDPQNGGGKKPTKSVSGPKKVRLAKTK